jgi:hypothetical protein
MLAARRWIQVRSRHFSFSMFREPGIHSAGHVFDASESMVEQQLHGLGGAAAGLAMDEDFAVFG